MTDRTELLARVHGLLPKVTPSPWSIAIEDHPDDMGCVAVSGGSGSKLWGDFAYVVVRMSEESTNCEDGEANAALIALTPDLARHFADLMRENERLRDVLEPLAHHPAHTYTAMGRRARAALTDATNEREGEK